MRSKIITVLVIFFLNFINFCLLAQQAKIDELKKSLLISGEDTARVKILSAIAMNYARINLDSSFKYASLELELSKQLSYKKGIASGHNSVGVAHYYKNEFQEALENWEKSLHIYEELKNLKGITDCYNAIGIVYGQWGRYDKTIEYMQKALEIKSELGDKKGIAGCYLNMGNVFRNQASYEKAIDSYNKALRIFEEINDSFGISTCTMNMGNVFNYLKNNSEALKYFQKALILFEEKNDTNAMSICYHNIGSTNANLGMLDKAAEYYFKSLKIDTKTADRKSLSLCYGSLSYLFIKFADREYSLESKLMYLDSSVYYGIRSLKLAYEISSRQQVKRTLNHLSIAYWGLKRISEADTCLNKLIGIHNEDVLMNFSFIPEKEQENFISAINYDYSLFNSFALQNAGIIPEITNKVYDIAIKNKGLLLKSSTAMRNAVHNSNDTLLINKYDEWIILKMQIAKSLSAGKEVTDMEKKANEIEGFLIKNSKEFSDFKQVQNISWNDVRNTLKSDEAALEFIQFNLFNPENMDDNNTPVIYCALVLKAESQHPEMIPLFHESMLEKIIGVSVGNSKDYVGYLYNADSNSARELYDLIWKPLEHSLQAKRTIYISPAGLLHKISFPAIVKKENFYLCDELNQNILSGTGKIVYEVNRKNKIDINKANISLFGGVRYNSDSTIVETWKYLEGTKQETEIVNEILKSRNILVNSFTDEKASEVKFKQIADKSEILHIATHGFFYPDPDIVKIEMDAKTEHSEHLVFRGGKNDFGMESFVSNKNSLMRSGLVLAYANDVWGRNKMLAEEDGVLTAQEVVNLDLRNTILVVLSACETGLGDIRGSEGVYGLQRAFKMAGVKYIIMSLWQVPDKETVEFMEMFYKKLLKQKDVRLAFNETQKEMRQKYDPYYWGAFVLIE